MVESYRSIITHLTVVIHLCHFRIQVESWEGGSQQGFLCIIQITDGLPCLFFRWIRIFSAGSIDIPSVYHAVCIRQLSIHTDSIRTVHRIRENKSGIVFRLTLGPDKFGDAESLFFSREHIPVRFKRIYTMRAFREFIVFVIEFEVISIGRQFRCVCRTANCVKVVQIQINHSFGGNCCDSPLMRVIILREIGLIVRASQEVIIVFISIEPGACRFKPYTWHQS